MNEEESPAEGRGCRLPPPLLPRGPLFLCTCLLHLLVVWDSAQACITGCCLALPVGSPPSPWGLHGLPRSWPLSSSALSVSQPPSVGARSQGHTPEPVTPTLRGGAPQGRGLCPRQPLHPVCPGLVSIQAEDAAEAQKGQAGLPRSYDQDEIDKAIYVEKSSVLMAFCFPAYPYSSAGAEAPGLQRVRSFRALVQEALQ